MKNIDFSQDRFKDGPRLSLKVTKHQLLLVEAYDVQKSYWTNINVYMLMQYEIK